MVSKTALHEAAHVLAALGHEIGVLHASIDEVILRPPGDSLERGRHHGAVAVGYGITALAGGAAAPGTGLSKSDDLLLERALFLGSWSDSPDEVRRALSALADSFAHDHRTEIERLAVVLEQRRSISGIEVAEIIEGWGRDQ
ncbi:hypothetical protein ELH49_20740 [Rhizobium ruizarguesonis]|uniref:hypothetical protein n=1 Tax=Rhizobium leguminosarum TaxID=384 RepID=UPI00102F5B3B|nr:hypothetical protein [Rhizobium leguminosarum]MBY5488684.1 hypothetical protein [Rhizobium leguminosarum]TBB46306.1 hypothetical protein ELH49_20740 [Rhizobium ruizarguesonis]